MDKISLHRLLNKWNLVFKILPILIAVIVLKLIVHSLGYEVISLNTLYTSLVAGTIFLLGFLITGVLSDYKESEKIPGELSASIESLHDDAYTILKAKKSKTAKRFLQHVREFSNSLVEWFYKRERSQVILRRISDMNDLLVDLELEGITANFIIRMKNEQGNLRKLVIRAHTIRDTEFIQSAYAIAEALAICIVFGLVIIKVEPFYESLFFTVIVTFLISYMLFLIRDLDNPFDYVKKGEVGSEIPLKPLYDLNERLMREIS